MLLAGHPLIWCTRQGARGWLRCIGSSELGMDHIILTHSTTSFLTPPLPVVMISTIRRNCYLPHHCPRRDCRPSPYHGSQSHLRLFLISIMIVINNTFVELGFICNLVCDGSRSMSATHPYLFWQSYWHFDVICPTSASGTLQRSSHTCIIGFNALSAFHPYVPSVFASMSSFPHLKGKDGVTVSVVAPGDKSGSTFSISD
jgi:hypothetical protein